MNQSGIYAIVHILSGTRYVGQTNSLERRWLQHQDALNLGKHHNQRLQKKWIDDGPSAFEFKVLEYAPAYLDGIQLQKWMMKRESYFISTHKSTGHAFNIVDAELVETKASKSEISLASPNQNHQISQQLSELKPRIEEIEQVIRTLQQLVRDSASKVAAAENSSKPKFFGLASIFSHVEVERLALAKVLLLQVREQHNKLELQLREATSILNELTSRRTSLIQSYTGNQKRRATRLRMHSMI